MLLNSSYILWWFPFYHGTNCFSQFFHSHFSCWHLHCFKLCQYVYSIFLLYFWVSFGLIQVAKSSNMPPSIRDTLYQNLPPSIKSALRSKIQSIHVNEMVFLLFVFIPPARLSRKKTYEIETGEVRRVSKFHLLSAMVLISMDFPS